MPDGFEEDKDGLPEWCLDDEDEEMGTFDASGAFLPLKVSARRRGWEPALLGSSSSPPTQLFSAPHPRPMQKGPKEPIPEEQELDFQGLEEEEEPSEGLEEEGPEAGEPVGCPAGLGPGRAGMGGFFARLGTCCPPTCRIRLLRSGRRVLRGGEEPGGSRAVSSRQCTR